MRYLSTAVLDDQLKQGNVVRNVATLVDRVFGDVKGFRTLTEAEVFAILDHGCRDQHVWALALYGMRRGEIAGLRWTNVNLTDKVVGEGNRTIPLHSVRIEENRVAVGKVIETESPKSKASNRTLPLPQEVVNALKVARKQQTEERLAFGEGFGSGEYVASDEGRALPPESADVPMGQAA
jgi:integrase